MQHKRKTISGNDVIEAMREMDFERFVEPLQQALEGKIMNYTTQSILMYNLFCLGYCKITCIFDKRHNKTISCANIKRV